MHQRDGGAAVSEVDALQREIERLRARAEQLEQRATAAERALERAADDAREAKAQLDRGEQLRRAVFDGALDAMLVADDSGTYVDANRAACELFRQPRERLLGRTVGGFAAPGFDTAAPRRSFRAQGGFRGEFPLQLDDGTRRTLEYSAIADALPGLHLLVVRDVTDRRDTATALRRNEARFRAMVERSAEAVSLISADGTLLYMSQPALRILGWSSDAMLGQQALEHVLPEDLAMAHAQLGQLVTGHAMDLGVEVRVKHRDGTIHWVEATGTNLLADPDVQAIVCNFRDVTARRLAEEALREGRRRLEEAQAIAHVGSWTGGTEARDVMTWSRECYRITGVPEGTEVTVASFLASIHSDDRSEVMRVLREALVNGTPIDHEHRVQRPGGEVRWVRERVVVLPTTVDGAVVARDASGRPATLVGTMQDVTDRRSSLEALRASEERYRRIIEHTSEGVLMYGPDGITAFANTRMAEMLGCAVHEVEGRPIVDFIEESDRPLAVAWIARHTQGGAAKRDFRLRRRDGTTTLVSIHADALFDAHGRYEAVLALVTDVSAERRADEARARLAALVEWSDDAIVSTSLDGAVTSWNVGAEQLYLYPAEEVVGTSISRLIPRDTLADEQRMFEQVARGEVVRQHETRRIRKDGTVVDVALTVSPIRDGDGTIIGTSDIARDLTARRQAEAVLRRTEEQFRQAQKMEAVGRLAGGVAHDFNNLLSVILSYAEFALVDLKPGDPLRDDFGEIQKAGRRAAELTRQLLAFGRQQLLQPRVINLNDVVRGIERMLARLLGEDIELTLALTPSLHTTLADPGQIEQVVMNLAVNARDAMPDGGTLTLETRNVQLGPSDLEDNPSALPGGYVQLTVRDTGTGMDPATRARAFEPFFTTKEQGKGTGLGLSTVFGIVRQSGGHVAVESTPGAGSAFHVYLAQTNNEATVPPERSAARLLRGAETILLAEDEEQVRAVACAILRRHGYHVLETSNGEEALHVSREFRGPIDLLVTDVVMPRMGGRKLVEQLAVERHDTRVLFVSGYTDDAIVHLGVLGAEVAFLQKPFTPDTLLRRVREVLDGAPPATSRHG